MVRLALSLTRQGSRIKNGGNTFLENKADTKNNTISEIFGDGRLSYDEFLMKTGEAGIEIGDVGEVRGAFEKKIEGLRKNSALERELDRAGVKNRSLITRLINMDEVTADDDGVSGISEQIDSLRESDPYLFEEKSRPSAGAFFNSGLSHGREVPDEDSMSDSDFYKKIKKL